MLRSRKTFLVTKLPSRQVAFILKDNQVRARKNYLQGNQMHKILICKHSNWSEGNRNRKLRTIIRIIKWSSHPNIRNRHNKLSRNTRTHRSQDLQHRSVASLRWLPRKSLLKVIQLWDLRRRQCPRNKLLRLKPLYSVENIKSSKSTRYRDHKKELKMKFLRNW